MWVCYQRVSGALKLGYCWPTNTYKHDMLDHEMQGAKMSEETKTVYGKVAKVDDDLGLVMGFAIICKENGEPYFDVQGDHIPEDAMMKAAADFMANSRVAKEMHDGGQVGSVVFAFPLTEDIAKAMGLGEVENTGLMIAMQPSDDDVLEKFRSGEYTGFSIGGRRLKDEEVQ